MQLQPLLTNIGVLKSVPCFVIESWQDGLQQPNLTGDELGGLPHVRDLFVVQNDREGGVFGNGDNGDDQKNGSYGK